MRLKYILILGLLLAGLFTSCNKDENKKAGFGALSEGAVLFFDKYDGSDIKVDYYSITVADRLYQAGEGTSTSGLMNIIDTEIAIKRGGLYGLAYENCNMFAVKKFEFLYAPNKATLNQELLQYSCGREITHRNKIIKVDTLVTVPMGVFNTYVMQHKEGDKSYWNADKGLVMYERIDRATQTIKETYKLNRIM